MSRACQKDGWSGYEDHKAYNSHTAQHCWTKGSDQSWQIYEKTINIIVNLDEASILLTNCDNKDTFSIENKLCCNFNLI